MPLRELLFARSIDGELSPFFVIWTVFVALFGATIGSFINVVALRLPAGISFVRPRSRCPRCQHMIAWYDNIPIASFVLLRGRCRHCGGAISWQYPLVEAIAGGIALGLWLTRGPSFALLVDGTVCGLLLTLAVIDARTYLLPEPLTIPLIVVALAGRVLVPWLDLDAAQDLLLASLIDGVVGGALGFLLFAAIRWIGTRVARRSGRIGPDEDALGTGDLVLISGIGAHLGLAGTIGSIMLASVQGALVGGLLLLLRRGHTLDETPAADSAGEQAEKKTAPEKPKEDDDNEDADDWRPPPWSVPFGPFLALATLEWLFAGPWIEPRFFSLFARLLDLGG